VKYRDNIIENIAINKNIAIYRKIPYFSTIRYDTIHRYRKPYIDIFDISSHHYYRNINRGWGKKVDP